MRSKSKPEIVIATWPNADPGYGYWGDRDYADFSADCASTWLSLRLVDPSDNDGYISYQDRDTVSNAGIYIWFMKNSSMIVKVSGHEIHSLDMDRCEALLKFLRKMNKKLEGMPQHKSGEFFECLMNVMQRLGIKRAVEYSSKPDAFPLVCFPVKKIADTLAQRHTLILGHHPDKEVETV